MEAYRALPYSRILTGSTSGLDSTYTGDAAINPPVGDTYWVERSLAAVPAAGTPTNMSVTYPGATHPDRWNIALIEIRPR